MGIAIDIGIGVIILIAAIIGIVKGFHKQFTKGFCNFVAFCAAIALTSLVTPLLRNMEFYQNLQGTAAGWFTAEYLSAPIDSVETLRSTLENSSLAILSNASDQIFATMQQTQANTLAQFFGNAIINIAAAFIVWLVIYLVIKFTLFGVRSLMTKAASLPVFKSIDKIFGLICAEILAYLIVVVLALTIVEIITCSLVPNWIEPMRNIIASSRLLSVAHNFNLGSILARLIGIDLTVLSPV